MLFGIFINNYYTISTIYNTILFKLEVMAAKYRYLAGSHFFFFFSKSEKIEYTQK